MPPDEVPFLDVLAETISSVRPMPLDAQTTRDLSRAAQKVTAWTERRNTLIHEAHAAGGGVREIARATGLNVGTVHNILFGRKRGGTSDAATR